MKVLLTGATGFLGKALWVALQEQGHKIVIASRKPGALADQTGAPGCEDACATDRSALAGLFARHADIDVVLHAATDYGHDAALPTTTFWGNMAFPVGLLELAMVGRERLFINIDTFFNQPGADYAHLGSYTLSKRHFQEWGRLCANQGRIRFANLRLFHLYGPGDGEGKFVTWLVRRCAANKPIDLTDGLQRRDFIHIDDAVSAVMAAMKHEAGLAPGYAHYDVGTGASVTIRQFVEEIKRLGRSASQLNFGALPRREGEFVDACADPRPLNAIGWHPQTSIQRGIATLFGQDDSR